MVCLRSYSPLQYCVLGSVGLARILPSFLVNTVKVPSLLSSVLLVLSQTRVRGRTQTEALQ